MHIQKLINHTHVGCRLCPCNILSSSHLNHFWVQPELLHVLKLFRSAVVPFFSIKYSHSASYSGATYNQRLLILFTSLQLTVLASHWNTTHRKSSIYVLYVPMCLFFICI